MPRLPAPPPAARRSRTGSRRLRLSVVLASVVTLGLIGISCGAEDPPQAAVPDGKDAPVPSLLPRPSRPTLPPVSAPTTSTPPPRRTVGSTPIAPPTEEYAVGLTTMGLTDSTRPSAARGDQPERDSRTFVTTIRYPAAGPPGVAEGQLDAAPDGPFPLVVFAHGFNSSAARYDQLLHQLASAGYVVAAPDFPLTSAALPGEAVRADVPNQPDDITFLISKLLTANDQPGTLLNLVDQSKIAVMGHSDGGNTAAAIAYNACCTDKRVKAAVLMAAEKDLFPDSWTGTSGTPFLGFHSDKDEITPYANGEALYRIAGPPKYFVTVLNGNHEDPFTDGAQLPAVSKVVTDFLEAYLGGDPSAESQLRDDASIGGVFKLEALS